MLNSIDNKRCIYISLKVPFIVPDGTSYCFYYSVFCKDDVFNCPFNYLPHHLVHVNEFSIYPVQGYQLSLFDF